MRPSNWLLAAALAFAAAIPACGSGDSGGGSGGQAGAAGGGGGSGGAGATGGSGGSSGADAGSTGGGAGAAGSAGSDASAGTGGVSGTAGIDGGAGTDSGAGAAGAAGGAGADAGGDGGIGKSAPYPPVPYPPENPATDEKRMLGKILFWEEQISSDDSMACGTCHRAGAGGSDPRASLSGAVNPGPDKTFGTADDIHGAMGIARCKIVAGAVQRVSDPVFGMNVQVTRRKPPSYLDAMLFTDVFWDGRATSQFTAPGDTTPSIVAGGALESQSMGPPVADAEMACENRTWADIVAKLQGVQPLAKAHDIPPDMKDAIAANPTYPDLFNWVYGTPEISAKRIAFAIATHERRLVSDQTPWDLYNAGDDSALTAAEKHGLELYMTTGRCNKCHAPPMFSDGLYHNLGFVAVDPAFDDGRAEFTGLPADSGKVLTPTLRNVALREAGGLLHYGAGPGASLKAVMDSYNNPPSFPNRDPLIINLGLSTADINDVIDFMQNGLTDPRVAAEQPPFDRPKLGSEP